MVNNNVTVACNNCGSTESFVDSECEFTQNEVCDLNDSCAQCGAYSVSVTNVLPVH